MEEQMIEAARPHLVLYDPNHKDYVKSKLKEDIWSAIVLYCIVLYCIVFIEHSVDPYKVVTYGI